MPFDEPLISAKQLADKLGRHYGYVYWMRRRGFRMVAGRTTLTAAISWLARNPTPTAGRSRTRQNKA